MQFSRNAQHGQDTAYEILIDTKRTPHFETRERPESRVLTDGMQLVSLSPRVGSCSEPVVKGGEGCERVVWGCFLGYKAKMSTTLEREMEAGWPTKIKGR